MAMSGLSIPSDVTLPFIVVAADGSGDFSSISAAVSSLTADGATIYVKEGTYTASGDITIGYNNVTIIGANKSAIAKRSSTTASFIINGKSGIKILGLTIEGVADGSQSGLKIIDSSNITIKDCYFTGYLAGCIELRSSDNCLITNNWFGGITHGTAFAVYIWTYDTTDSKNNTISNNWIKGLTDVSVYLESGEVLGVNQNIISGNQILDGGSWGIQIVGANCNKTLILGNVITGNSSGAVSDGGTGTINQHNVT